jgi:hypothetical protein
MYLFKAKQAANAELERACEEHGVTIEQVRAFLEANPGWGRALHKAPHAFAGSAADLVAEVAPYITKSRVALWRDRVSGLARRSSETARKSPQTVTSLVALFKNAANAAPEVAARVKQDVALYRELRRQKKGEKAPAPVAMDAAAE